jgi:hypothetical protein
MEKAAEAGRDHLVVDELIFIFLFFFHVSVERNMSKPHADELNDMENRVKYAEAFDKMGGGSDKLDRELQQELAFRAMKNNWDFDRLETLFFNLQGVLSRLFQYFPPHKKPRVSDLLMLALGDKGKFQNELMESSILPMTQLEHLAGLMMQKGGFLSDEKKSRGVARSYQRCRDLSHLSVNELASPMLMSDLATEQLLEFGRTPVLRQENSLRDGPKRVIFCILNPNNPVPCRLLLNTLRYSRELKFELQFVTALRPAQLFCVGEEDGTWMKELIQLMLFPPKFSDLSGSIAPQEVGDAARFVTSVFVLAETVEELPSAAGIIPCANQQFGVICGPGSELKAATPVPGSVELIDMRRK